MTQFDMYLAMPDAPHLKDRHFIVAGAGRESEFGVPDSLTVTRATKWCPTACTGGLSVCEFVHGADVFFFGKALRDLLDELAFAGVL